MKMLMASVSRIAAAALLGGCAAGVTTAARAETLIEALTAAYKSNPTLSGARARQRGVDENVALAKADGRPAASLGGTYLFALPGSTGAVKDGWDGILATQLDIRHQPCNFVELMPRLREA